MNLKRTLNVFLKNLGYIVLTAVICAVIAAAGTFILPTEYETKAQLMVNTYNPGSEKVLDEYMVSHKMASTFVTVAMSNPVLDKVNEKLGTNYSDLKFSRMVSVKNVNEIINITVKGTNVNHIKDIANAMAGTLVEHVEKNIFPGQSSGLLKVINDASDPQKPGLLLYIVNAFKGGVLGGAISVILVFLMDLIKAPVKSARELKTLLDMDVVGKIKLNSKLSDLSSKQYDTTEFRFMRVNIHNRLEQGKDKVLGIVSPGVDEGKTTICLNLAANISLTGKRVLMIDCNMSKPELSEIFGYTDKTGVCELISADSNDINDYKKSVYDTSVRNLFILPAGKGDCHNIIGSSRMSDIVNALKNEFDFILVDTPAALIQSEASEILYLFDKTIIIAEYDKTSAYKISKLKEIISLSRSEALGVVINKVRKNKGSRI